MSTTTTRRGPASATSSARLDKAELKGLSGRSDAKGLAQLGLHVAALTITGMLVWQSLGTLWLFPAWVLHGLVLVFLFTALHECIHRTAFRSRWLNGAVAWFCAVPLVLPPRYFRAFHLAHHRWTQDRERDPELAGGRPETLGAYLWHVTGLPYWSAQLTLTLRHAAGRVDLPFATARERPGIVREARVLLAILAAMVVGSLLLQTWAVAIYLWVPALFGQPFLRAFLLAEHAGCPFVPDMLRNTRTTWTNALVRRIAWNAPYHAEHHAYPAIPFHALPKVHRTLRGRIEIQAKGYIQVHRDIVADLSRSATG